MYTSNIYVLFNIIYIYYYIDFTNVIYITLTQCVIYIWHIYIPTDYSIYALLTL